MAAYSKVIFDDRTLIDLTKDSVEAGTLLYGNTAHGKDGELIQGTFLQGHPDEFTLTDALSTSSDEVLQTSDGYILMATTVYRKA